MPHRILLVDDHQLFRNALAALLSASPLVTVVGEVDDARAAYRVVEQTHPDLVLTEIALPGESGLSLTRELLRRDKSRKVLIVTAQVSEQLAAEAFAAGALGYFVTHDSGANLLQAIERVAIGRRYLAPMLSYERIETALVGDDTGPLRELSRREREVFDMLVRGLNNATIAEHLFISVKTVETHRTHIMKKLAMHSLSEMVRFAAQHGLLTGGLVDRRAVSASG